ncbi:MAG TPA: DUF4260 domain-containing protein [Gemmatimonadaceae bacterium]
MNTTTDAVTGPPRVWLRLEGLATLVVAIFLFERGGHSWALFALLFLAPDASFGGYLLGPRAGAWIYNAAHSYVGPLVLAVVFVATGRPPVLAIIWAGHIGFDRALGYGLKYPTAFQDTHLGRIGRTREARPAG